MSQSCFSLGFLSQNSLWRLSTFRGYKGIYSRVYEECQESVTTKQDVLVIRACNWNESRANYLAKLEVLSYNATAGMTLQLLLHASHVCHFGDLAVASQSQDSLELHTSQISSLSHTLPLHNSYLDTGYLIAKLQANLA